VIEKRRMESLGGQPEKKIVVVKFRNRIIETNLDDSEFERTEIGAQNFEHFRFPSMRP
jgi:hypothetical protein